MEKRLVSHMVEDGFKGWKELLQKPEIRAFMNEIKSNDFSCEQIKIIREGFEVGLTPEQVKLYANENYTNNCMEEIRQGLINGLKAEHIEVCKRFPH